MRIKEEKGSVTVIVIIAILFIVALATTMYFAAVNRKNVGDDLSQEIKQAYEKDVDNMDSLYATYQEESLNIYTKEDLEKFRDRVNSGISFEGKTVYLMGNIDLNYGNYTIEEDGTITFKENAKEWTPINSFKGVFEGNNYTISGLYINSTTTENQGLFKTNNGTVQNLKLKNGKINSTQNGTGAIVGQNAGTIDNIENYIVIENAGTKTGGIAGQNAGTISNCSNYAKLNSKDPNSDSEDVVGGIVGENNGKVEKCYNEEEIKGYSNIGGIAGDSSKGEINNCYNVADITGSQNVGGILGKATINQDYKISIKNSYNTGKISNDNGGEILGSTYESGQITIENCYFLEETVENPSNEEDVTDPNPNPNAKTEAEMKSEEFIKLLGADNWMIKEEENDGYPILK